ncbi:GNAT family N-acetyltransferase [Streptomyces parvus]|uniref:GNAT family N-acetyltransferase n=1 Tax=Streptomyces parvus TaxID=66428 RepID=UPI002100FAAA|nr:GNAT family N-acetyltransferase [Streptomyces parvus]MCQ1578124.1 N-acetyltransferase [Streptomyces parvus]
MESHVTDNPDESRYEIFDGGERAGFVEYHRFRDEIAFLHTEIDPRFGGRGLGGALARSVLDEARKQELKVLPFCPFIRGWLRKHPEYTDLVPETQHARFGL